MAYVMLHKMKMEYEHNLNLEPSFDVKENTTFKKWLSFEDYVKNATQIENHDFHYNLQNDLKKIVAIEGNSQLWNKMSKIIVKSLLGWSLKFRLQSLLIVGAPPRGPTMSF